MLVTEHAEQRLRSRVIDQRLATQLVARLEAAPGETGAVAYEVHRWAVPGFERVIRAVAGDGSNGDTLVVIAREGSVETVMLRRSWNQPFTRSALGVDRIGRLP